MLTFESLFLWPLFQIHFGGNLRYYLHLAVLQTELAKANEGNKAAAARARKATLELEKLGKEFRKVSIAEMK